MTKQKIAKNFFKLCAAYLLICLVMFAFQRHLIYQPSGIVKSPSTYGLKDFNEVNFTMSDSTQIRGWLNLQKQHSKTLIFIHGNAGNMADRASRYQIFSDNLNLNVIALTYRGFPGSTGTPSEQKIYQDFSEIIKILDDEYNIKTEDMIIYGASLGSGVAVEIASKNKLHALIIESPFTNLNDIAKLTYWFLPVDLILQDHFNSLAKASKINSPVMLIHAEKDTIVPLKFGVRLYEELPSPKKLFIYPGAEHVSLNYVLVANKIKLFLRDIKN